MNMIVGSLFCSIWNVSSKKLLRGSERKKDLSMYPDYQFGKQWFHPEEASNLRVRIHNLLVEEFKTAKESSAKC
ncbi:hypothetical protein L6452_09393 [Arctium lappa]|uniref:Uncharacterized protein n=1 Tax=Arctium lappa TaxID=4217 RepID=A0ACB9DL32_ARCLA|nr:hypothetical protein L6452_09393 [Arctium lappa]